MLLFPPALRPGDLVAVIAPSGPVPPVDFWSGLAWVQGRYRVRMSPRVLARDGFLAGGDALREADLRDALVHPDVKAVVAARGGHGAVRLLERLDLGQAMTSPRWIVGFSDITALHLAASENGLASLHGPNVTGLGRASPSVRAAWMAALERPEDGASWRGLDVLHPGAARGSAWGGNLTLLATMAAAGRLRVPEGCVLLLEDVDERPYRVDRMLSALRLGGHIGRAAAVVFGTCSGCEPGPDGVTVEHVLAERTGDLGVPVLAGAPFGHSDNNHAFVLGWNAAVEDGAVTFAVG